jgi:preprotein translocase subunit SecF
MFEGLRKIAKGESNIDIIGRSKIWALVSLVVIGVSLGGLLIKKLNLSLEFEGGTSLQVPLEQTVTVSEVEALLERFEVTEPEIQISTGPGGERQLLVRSERIEDRAILATVQGELARIAGQTRTDGSPDVDAVSISDVGPSWGRQVSNKALRGLIVFLVLVSLYISLRFEWKMALGALGALFHDLIATAGIYALVGFQVSPATVIALLTLMGFSLYDTVVVFDKVRENGELLTGSKMSYTEMVNRSLNQVMMRSINTSISSVLPVAGLLFVGVFLFGADTLKDLALAMFIGALVSTYSSIFVAAPILAWLKEREPRYRQLRERRGPAQPATATAGAASAPKAASAAKAAAASVEEAAPRATRPASRPVVRQTPRGRQRRRGKRRR